MGPSHLDKLTHVKIQKYFLEHFGRALYPLPSTNVKATHDFACFGVRSCAHMSLKGPIGQARPQARARGKP